MKKIIRYFIIDTASLYAVSTIASGMIFEEGIKTLVFAGVALTIASLVVKPVINLLLLPINLVTFNLFKWISQAITLYLVTLVVPGFRIVGFSYPGLQSVWIDLPAINLGGAFAFVAFALILSVLTSIVYWVIS